MNVPTHQILQNAYYDALFKCNLETADRELAQGQVAAVATLLDNYDGAISAVNQNGDLSAQGCASQILAISKSYLAKLATMTDGTLAGLQKQITDNQAALTQASRGADATTVTELRAREVREWFADVDPILRSTEYQKLLNSANYAACIAIENAPYTPLLDAETIAEGQAQRGAQALPGRAYAMTAATAILDILRDSVRFARRHMTLAETADPLVIAAMGGYSEAAE